MKKRRIALQILLVLIIGSISIFAQSNNVDNPTPITSSVVQGQIKARDIGDPRATVHYYVFEGNQGDIFLKIESNNLNGDIDIFYADSLRPVTKITVYADTSPAETGREIYLRKPERLILRVEGRTPTDDPATYSIRFEGSFVAIAGQKNVEAPKLPVAESESESGIKVNSVGTILETKPKPVPTPRETTARSTSRRTARTTTPQPISTIGPAANSKKETAKARETKNKSRKVEQDASDNAENRETVIESKETGAMTNEAGEPKTTTEPKPRTARKTTTVKKAPVKKDVPIRAPKPDPAAELAKALENVTLVIEFKDGAKIERPMNEVVRFGVDKGVLTIVNKNGTVGRYSIIDVAKVTIE